MIATALLLLATQQDWLPVPQGSRRVYVVEDLGAEAVEPAREVAAEAERPDPDGWVGLKDFLGYDRAWVRGKDGVILFRTRPAIDAPALPILKTGAREGESWTGEIGREVLTFTHRGSVPLEIGEERVNALHVEFTAADGDRHPGHASSTGRLWFVSGMGLVRAELTKDLDCHTHATRSWRLKP